MTSPDLGFHLISSPPSKFQKCSRSKVFVLKRLCKNNRGVRKWPAAGGNFSGFFILNNIFVTEIKHKSSSPQAELQNMLDAKLDF